MKQIFLAALACLSLSTWADTQIVRCNAHVDSTDIPNLPATVQISVSSAAVSASSSTTGQAFTQVMIAVLAADGTDIVAGGTVGSNATMTSQEITLRDDNRLSENNPSVITASFDLQKKVLTLSQAVGFFGSTHFNLVAHCD